MHHLKHAGLSAVTGLAALVACAVPASALGGGDPDPSHRETVVHLVAQPTQQSSLELDGPGPSQGDEIIISGDLLRDGQAVGTFGEVCTLTRTTVTDEGDLLCEGSLTLPQGQITFQGRFTFTAAGPPVDITLAITGGTGAYRTARGYIEAVNPSATQTQLTVHLIL